MKLSAVFLRRWHWLNLPGALLIALLQRTPVVRLIVGSGEFVVRSPAAQLMRSVFSVAALGALHSRAGATTYVQNPPNPVTGPAGTPLNVAFTYIGTPSEPQYFVVAGTLPPGLSFVPAPTQGVVISKTPAITGTPTQPGNYTVTVQGFGLAGNGTPQPINFVITGNGAVAPAFSVHPASQSVSAGGSVTFTAGATGSPAPTFQWRKDGNVIAGATGTSFSITNAKTEDSGDYTVVATNSAGSVTSNAAKLTVSAVSGNARLTNLSVRTAMAAGQTLIVGVVVNDGARDILVRAAGPALAAFGLSTAMADPQLELYRGTSMVLANNDWPASLAATFQSVGAFGFPTGSKDAAFVESLNTAYSIQARGTGPGVVLVEAYDTGAPTAARMINVSARNRVGTNDDILIAGFAVSGTGGKRLLIRAIGPRLGQAPFNIPGTLTDPKLEIYNNDNVKVTENDNWDSSLATTFLTVGAFPLAFASRDAALVTTLPAGTFTVQVKGADGGTGEALVEIYELP